VNRLRYGQPIVLGSVPDVIHTSSLSHLQALIINIVNLCCLVLMIYTSWVVKNSVLALDSIEPSQKRKAGRKEYLLLLGLLMVFISLAFRWIEIRIESQIYALTIATYLEVAGTVLFLVWLIITWNLFIVTSAIGLTVIHRYYFPVVVSDLVTFISWLPPLVFVLINVFRKGCEPKLRLIGIGLPLILMSTIPLGYVLQVPSTMHFSKYYKPTSQRPIDFPSYLQVPVGATDVKYKGGKWPNLYFVVQEPYPAEGTQNFISNNLKGSDWEKINLSSWSSLEHNTDFKIKSYEWSGLWVNSNDKVIRVALFYRFPEEAEEDLNTLYCNLWLVPLDDWSSKQIEYYKRFHQDDKE
jgi:hypothetical protein